MNSTISLNELYYRTIFYDANVDKVLYNYYLFNLDTLNGKDANLFQKLDNGEYKFIMVFRWADYQNGKYDKPAQTPQLSGTVNDDLKTAVPGTGNAEDQGTSTNCTNIVTPVPVQSQMPTININNITTKEDVDTSSDDFNEKIEKLLDKINEIKNQKSEDLTELLTKSTQPTQSITADNVTNVTVNVNVNDLMQLKKDAKAEYQENQEQAAKQAPIVKEMEVEVTPEPETSAPAENVCNACTETSVCDVCAETAQPAPAAATETTTENTETAPETEEGKW